ncbi:MAG: peptide chain release factor N(5)-glutamine methyltransferase [Acidimicrobiales bacterium]
MTWRGLWARADRQLGSSLEGRRIVERASGYDAAELLLHLDEPVPSRAVPFALGMIERRAAGEPLQYVLGRWGFRTLDLYVDRRVLIPRPETEAVVEVALGELRGVERPTVVDLGTGSGAIALSVAVEVPGATVWATDASADALAVARANLAGIGSRVAPRVQMAEGRWYDALPGELRGRIDLIVSNPPYVAADEDLPAEVADWEPAGALVAGATGLEAVVEIVAEAPKWLARPGRLVVEIAPHQAVTVEAMAHQASFTAIDVRPDLTGRLRAVVARLDRHERA